MLNEHFIGMTGFIFWIGVIENRNDPLKVGRAQCRIFGWNTESKSLLPTEQLQWAHPILPLNNDSVSLPVEGKMVFGFFMDGEAAQYPIMMGQIPGIPDTTPNTTHGFSDPRSDIQLAGSPRAPQSVNYSSSGTGVAIVETTQASRYPALLNEPTTSRIARNENIAATAIGRKQTNRVTSVPIGTGNALNPVSVGWSEPQTPYAAKYPFDTVTETESGHVFELDDTPGAERIHIFHRSGTFEEYGPDGSKVSKVTKNKTDITLADSNKIVMGTENETINGRKTLLVQGDYDITILGNCNLAVDGNIEASYSQLILKGNVILDGNMQVIGTVNATGDVTAGNISLEEHVHSGVISGGDITGTPSPF